MLGRQASRCSTSYYEPFRTRCNQAERLPRTDKQQATMEGRPGSRNCPKARGTLPAEALDSRRRKGSCAAADTFKARPSFWALSCPWDFKLCRSYTCKPHTSNNSVFGTPCSDISLAHCMAPLVA